MTLIEWQDYINKLNDIDMEIEHLQEKIIFLRVRAEGGSSISNNTRVQNSGYSDKVGNYGALIIDTQAKLKTYITERKRICLRILKLFSCLAEREKAVMIRYILQKQSMKEISDIIGISRQSAYRIHDRAVTKINEFISDKKELIPQG